MYKNLIRIFIFCIATLACLCSYAQELHLGLPISEFYPQEISDFHASAQFEGEQGMYFSAGKSLYYFNGYFDNLQTYLSPINTLFASDSVLYYGKDKAYGYVNTQFNSNNQLVRKFDQAEAEVSHISNSNYGNFILSKNKIFHFKNQVAKKYSFPGIVDFLGNVNNSTIVHDDTNGLSIFVGSRFKIVNNSRFLSSMQVIDIKSMGSGEYVVATRNNGLYYFDGENFSEFGQVFLENRRIVDIEVIQMNDRPNEVIIITDDNELISLNFSGDLVQEKLFTNKLLDLQKNEQNVLYVITASGIHLFYYNLPFQIIDRSPDPLHGPVAVFDDKFYWGTNNGLYYSNIQEQKNLNDSRIRVKDTEGKVGKLDVINGTLLMSHEDGLYDVLPKIGARFIPDERFYGFEDLGNDYVISFSDRNTYLLKKRRNRWRIVRKMDDFPIHPKSVVLDEMNNLWMVDRDYNVLQYKFDPRNELFELMNSTSNPDKVSVFHLNDQVVLIKESQLYTFNSTENVFEISDELTAVFGSEFSINQMTNDDYGNIWYLQNGKIGLFRNSNDNTSFKKLKIDFPFSDARFVYPFDKNNVFVNNGSYVTKINLENYSKMASPNIQFDKVISVKQNNKKVKEYDHNDPFASISKLSIGTKEQLEILIGQELLPDSEIQYSLSSDKDVYNWQVCPEKGKINIGNLNAGDYYLTIKSNSYRGSSNILSLPIEVGKAISDDNNIIYLIGFIALILSLIAFFAGYNIGARRA